jgi:hypothetical protein
MPRRYRLVALVAFALLVVAATWAVTGVPLRWTRGIVLADSCTGPADAQTCRVELVPDGTQVSAASGTRIEGGRWVELRVWHDLVSGRDTYTIVQ